MNDTELIKSLQDKVKTLECGVSAAEQLLTEVVSFPGDADVIEKCKSWLEEKTKGP